MATRAVSGWNLRLGLRRSWVLLTIELALITVVVLQWRFQSTSVTVLLPTAIQSAVFRRADGTVYILGNSSPNATPREATDRFIGLARFSHDITYTTSWRSPDVSPMTLPYVSHTISERRTSWARFYPAEGAIGADAALTEADLVNAEPKSSVIKDLQRQVGQTTTIVHWGTVLWSLGWYPLAALAVFACFFVYAISRRGMVHLLHCPVCGYVVGERQDVCPECGTDRRERAIGVGATSVSAPVEGT